MEKFEYWFVRVKEVGYNEASWFEQVEDLMFKLSINSSRDDAKKYCINRFGNFPFRKPKNAENGTRYFYLTKSDKYWWDKWYKERTLVCEYCGKEYTVIGDRRESKKHNYNGKSICSQECHDLYVQKLYNEYHTIENHDYWVSEDNHTLTDKNKVLAGYIYRITNKVTMNSYVGQTIKPPLFRWWQHLQLDNKFEQEDLTQLVFEVLEIVYYDENSTDNILYGSKQKKLNKRESYFIKFYDLVENGYNKKY